MRRLNRSWMATLVAALLLGALAGVVWARPNDKPQAADSLRKVTLTGGEFVSDENAQYSENGGGYVKCLNGTCHLYAPVVFPCLPSVNVERIKLHVNDSNGDEYAAAGLYRAYPTTGANVFLGQAVSPPGTSGGVRTYSSPDINQVFWPSQRAYISLLIGGPAINVHGVTVEYRRRI